ncbi:MAG: pitrilysin family protein [Candidatus Diapherotrites archaeon]
MKTVLLDNGLTLALVHFPGSTAGFDFCANYGPAFEGKKEAGIGHFLEHVFLSGSRKYGRKKPFSLVEGRGGELNAFTSMEETHFYSRVRCADFSLPAKIFGACFNDFSFKEKHVATEKKIILNEIKEVKDHPVKRLFDEFWEIALPKPFNRSILGTEKTVSKITPAMLERCLKKNYFSQNCVFGIATSLPEKKILGEIGSAFSFRAGRTKKIKAKAGWRKARERESIAKTEQAHCCLGFPVMPANSEPYFAMTLIDCYLGGGISSKLMQEIREKRGLSYQVATYLDVEKAHGVFAVYFSTKPEKVNEAKKLVLKEFERLQSKKLGSQVLSKLKNQVIGSKSLELENSYNNARLAVECLLYGWGSPEQFIEKIKAVSAEEIKQVARDFLQTEEYAFAKLLPEKSASK